MTDSRTVTLQPVVAEALIVWSEDSMKSYLQACTWSRRLPSQEGFREWCWNELDHYGSSLLEDFEVLDDPEGDPITLEIND